MLLLNAPIICDYETSVNERETSQHTQTTDWNDAIIMKLNSFYGSEIIGVDSLGVVDYILMLGSAK